MSIFVNKIEALDRFILSIVVARRRVNLTYIMVAFTRLGDGYLWAVCGFLAFMVMPNGRIVFTHAVLAFTLELSVYKLSKYFLPRLRPCDILPNITKLIIPPDQHSFPSGHTAAAFVMVFLVGMYVPILLPAFLLLAAGIAISRVYLGVHYPTDIAAGVLLGLSCGIVSQKLLAVVVV